jgi:NAD(P)-dependent dehydrogenase (short-subunit alcohol dehydrogenase family)
LDPLLEEFGADKVRTTQANLGIEDEVLNMFAEPHSFGPIQIVIINHGIWTPEDVLLKDMSLDRWSHTIQTNLTSSFLVAREYMRQLEKAPTSIKDGASICFIGSCAGKHPPFETSDNKRTGG